MAMACLSSVARMGGRGTLGGGRCSVVPTCRCYRERRWEWAGQEVVLG